ncbi:MAG TPA: RluA family pseudouridine synthase [Pyrinomonadaceae bacterium]|nr:RluA family pseudouridine synthase [Pyrinomonadaceae bacterium]
MSTAAEESPSSILHPSSDDAGKRLDAFLTEKVEGWSRSRLQRLIENGDVLVNQKEAKPSYKLKLDDEIDIDLTEEPAARFEPENIPLGIVFEDEYLAVINKPAGMIVHPGSGVTSGTLANAIAWHFRANSPPHQEGVPTASAGAVPPEGETQTANRVGIVHRLDKDTSGLIIVAKDEQAHELLAEQFRSREVYKSYVALVHGSPRENSGTIDRPIARDRWHRTKMTVAANGRSALSIWKVRQRFEKFALLDVEIKTGRTHQIRVHLASINHPVVGDITYNEGRDNTIADSDIKRAVEKLNRFFLHAEKLRFKHPVTGALIDLVQSLPGELEELLSTLR